MDYTTLVILVIIRSLAPSVMGHGRMMEPPQRSSMFRAFPGQGFEPNYNDNELFCGGFQRQWEQNGGKCGPCGDPYDGERKNEAGGIYATGFIGRRYQKGQDIDVEIQLTANHLGYMQFKICPHNDINTPVSQECLDKHLLELAGQPGVTKYEPGSQTGSHLVKLSLPADMTCEQCILQWHYIAGNNHNCDSITGECCKGCGPQETFINCADIAIDGDSGIVPATKAQVSSTITPTVSTTKPLTSTTTKLLTTTTPLTATTTTKPLTSSTTKPLTSSTATPLISTTTKSPTSRTRKPPISKTKLPRSSSTALKVLTTAQVTSPTTSAATISNPGNHNPTCAADERLNCIGVGVYGGLGFESWCDIYCSIRAPACTADLCRCRCVKARNCYATGLFDNIPGMDGYCKLHCQEGCPDISNICKCDT